jgi:iron complex outermembrane recepter protein
MIFATIIQKINYNKVMRISVSIIIMMLGVFSFSNAQNSSKTGSVSGKVTTTNAKGSVFGAIVRIPDVSASAVVNSEGVYTIPNVPNGIHLIEIQLTGYSPISDKITVNGATEKDFSLVAYVAEDDQLTVTGSVGAQRLKLNPTSVSVFRKPQLLATAANSLVDALAQQAKGVTTYTTGPAITKPIIRGLGYNRAVVVSDGLRQEGQQWGDEHGLEVDEYAVERVEILRGPASLAYGSDALGGVINISSLQPVANGVLKGNLMYHGGLNNRLNGFYGDLQGNENGFHFGIKASGRAAGDYENSADGNVLNSRFNERGISGYAGIRRSWGGVTLFASNLDQQLGIVTGDRNANGNFILYKGTPFETLPNPSDVNSKIAFTPNQNVYHTRFGLNSFFNVGKHVLDVTLGNQKNVRKEFGDPTAPTTPELQFNLNTINYNVALKFAEKNGWKTTLGVNGMQQENKIGGEEFIIPEYTLFDAGVYAITNKTFGKTTLSGGVRYDNRSVNSDIIPPTILLGSKSFSNVSGSLGISVAASDKLTFKLNAARGFRAPNIPELTSFGIHEGTNRFEIGNRNLKSETSLQFDAAVEVNSEHFSLSLTPFYNRINNYIFYNGVRNALGGDSTVVVDGEDVRVFKFSQDKPANLRGFEFNVDFHPHPLDWLHFENTFSFVRGTFGGAPSSGFVNTDFNLPFMPAPRWLSEIRAQFLQNGENMRNAYFKVQMDRVSAQEDIYGLNNTEGFTSNYTLFNVGLGTELHFNNYHFVTVHAGVQNAGDVAYQSHLSRLKYTDFNASNGRTGVHNMGQNYYVKVNFPLNFRPVFKKKAPMPVMVPKDSDGDGIFDGEDDCPYVPGIAKYKGCPIPDTDGDGINDEEDKCVDVKGTKEYQGCPPPADTDGDSIIDAEDKCPTEYGSIANQGCPDMVSDTAIAIVERASKNILFENNSSKLRKVSYTALDEVAELLMEDPNLNLEIEGHTDSRGDEAFNQKLSERRAAAARAYLIKKGVDASRIISTGFGESQPVDTNDTEEGRFNNRRVILKLVNAGGESKKM